MSSQMRSQGLPVNIIVLTALGLIVLVVVAAFFITGMSGAAQQTSIVEDFQAYCNGLCGQMVVAANNANDISALGFTQVAQLYQGSGCAREFGCCTVTLRSGEQVCAEGNCDEDSDCSMICLPITDYALNAPIDPGCNSRILIQYPYGDCFPATQVCDLVEGSSTKNKCIADPDGCFFVKEWYVCEPYCIDLGYRYANGCTDCLSPAGPTCACRIPI